MSDKIIVLKMDNSKCGNTCRYLCEHEKTCVRFGKLKHSCFFGSIIFHRHSNCISSESNKE